MNAVQFFNYLIRHESSRDLAVQLVDVYTHRIDVDRKQDARVPCSSAR